MEFVCDDVMVVGLLICVNRETLIVEHKAE